MRCGCAGRADEEADRVVRRAFTEANRRIEEARAVRDAFLAWHESVHN